MKRSRFTQKIYSYLLSSQQWYLKTPERSLDEAYKAALVIKAMEDEHFNGNKIAPESASYGDSVMAYFQSELKKQLKTVRMRLTEFKVSRLVDSSSTYTITKLVRNDGTTIAKDSFNIQPRNNPSFILEKLRFIDEVLAKYTSNQKESSVLVPAPQNVQLSARNVDNQQKTPVDKTVTKRDEVGLVPRSIVKTINRLQLELDPKAKEEVVKNFQISQKRTLISVRFILLLIVVPFITHQLSKNLIIGPIVDHSRSQNESAIFLNYEMKEKALVEMQMFEEEIKFKNILSEAGAISSEQVEEQMRDKAHEIAEEFRAEGSNAIKNVFADILAVGAFIGLFVVSKREIAVLKDFIDNIVYGLSDSAKAFIIILLTDVFVGFHSPHGWEVLLAGISRHLGIPENHDFFGLFIATFPVILDTIFKYWIFRYLSRISPSAVATYRNMNE